MGKSSTAKTSTVPRLCQNALSLPEIIASSLANIAPAMCIFFSLALMVDGAGIAAPLTMIVAAIAIIFHANSITEFTRAIPSAGSYITFIGSSFGPTVSGITALAVAFGYIVAIGAVMTMMGYWTGNILKIFLGITIPWQLIAIAFVAFVMFLTIRGIKLSTHWVIGVFLFELAMLFLATIAIFIRNPGYITLAPFNPANLKNGFQGISLGFPIAIFMFIGVGNSAALAEETEDPRRNVPRAVYTTVLVAAVLYLLFGYASIVGLHNNAAVIAKSDIPFLDAGKLALGHFIYIVYLAGFTSILACLIGATNAQTRMLFSASREGILPGFLSKVSKNQTPYAAIFFYSLVAMAITLSWGISAKPLDLYGFLGTLGSIPVILIYVALNFALPVYYKKNLPGQFSPFRHMVMPIISTLTLLYPLWGMIEPGQPKPFNYFPYIVLTYLVLAVAYAIFASSTNKDFASNVGTVIADQ